MTPWPLSVDSSVWPSVFSYQSKLKQKLCLPAESNTIEIEPTSFRHQTVELWSDYRQMEAVFQKRTKQQKGLSVAITMLAKNGLDPWEKILFGTERPTPYPRSWQLVGYDVADQWMLSGLTNCEYRADEVHSLRKEWDPK